MVLCASKLASHFTSIPIGTTLFHLALRTLEELAIPGISGVAITHLEKHLSTGQRKLGFSDMTTALVRLTLTSRFDDLISSRQALVSAETGSNYKGIADVLAQFSCKSNTIHYMECGDMSSTPLSFSAALPRERARVSAPK